jgi:hypothetical protein
MADHQIIEPPQTLRSKVKLGGPKAVDPEVLARAEAVITSMAGDYLQWVEKDLANIQHAWDELKASPDGLVDKEKLDRIYQISHDIKGQGGSFGYQLMTVIGDKLCRFIEHLDRTGTKEIKVIHLHIDAMRVVIAQRIQDKGGAIGAQLVAGLDQVTAKVKK